jgi:drug/metabolite transporter (DMT)-like permease
VTAAALTTLAMLAFAANSLLCRFALGSTETDPASFTLIRVASGAVTLAVIAMLRGGRLVKAGNWFSAVALFAYAAAFSFAYRSLDTGTGALLLFGAVQFTMTGWGIAKGERPGLLRAVGMLTATAGLVYLFLPGASAPDLVGASLMVIAGGAWGIYSLRGRGSEQPLEETAANFVYAVPLVLALSFASRVDRGVDEAGVLAAIASGAVASGVGYAIWYAALRDLRATTAATVQLSVPVIAAIAGVMFLDETTSLRMMTATVAILGGIGMVILGPTGTRSE